MRTFEGLNHLKILYVEDEEPIRVLVENRLKRMCENLFVAHNGAKGLEVFLTNEIDIVITDVSMPEMDGLEMTKRIKEKRPDTPIILTTAHSDEEHFLDSIEVGVDKYIIKPIRFDELNATLEKMGKLIEDRKLAKEYQKKMLEEQINSATMDAAKILIDAQPNPIFAVEGETISFVNKAFADIVDRELLEKISQNITDIDTLLYKKEGYLESLQSIDFTDFSKNIISIKQASGRKIYKVFPKRIKIHDNETTLYTLNDITLLEYQKIKIKNYNSMLEGYIFDVKYKKRDEESQTTNVAQPRSTTAEIPIATQDTLSEDNNREKISLSDTSMALLRKTHIHKTTATEYIAEIDSEVIEQIQELEELEGETNEIIYTFRDTKEISLFTTLSQKFFRISSVLNILIEFKDLAYAFEQLSDMLRNAATEELDESKIKKATVYLLSIIEELQAWRINIFVNQDAIDIHYLDASFFSSCLQLELELKNKSAQIEQEDEDDDLILF